MKVECKMVNDCVHKVNEECPETPCEFYNPIDNHIPEGLEDEIEKAEAEEKEAKPILQFSTLPKFDKHHEFVVMKNHVFQFQSISPKKLILKFKRKLNDKENIPDGCYTFTNPVTKKLLDQSKIFGVLNANNKKMKDKKSNETSPEKS